MEAGYNVNFRISDDALTDGFAPATFSFYGGSITTPYNLSVIVMEYAGHTWRLPKVRAISKSVPVTALSPEDSEDIECFTDVSTCNSFARLPDIFDHDDEAHVPDFFSTERVEGLIQLCFELMCRNRKEAITMHRTHGHPNNRTLLLNLEAAGLPYKHLKRYILAISCDACRAAIGKRDNKTSTVALAKRQALAQQKKADKAQRKLFAQQKSNLNSSTDSILISDKLDLSPISDTVDPTSTITESLAHLHEFTASSDSFYYSSLKPSLPTSVIGGDMPLGSENSRYQTRFNENAAFRKFNDTPHAPVVTQCEQPNATHSQPNTDLQMDWTDACSLGRLPFESIFSFILDKGTEFWATYPCKTRGTGTPVELLEQYITTTGRTPRYLRIDNAKEFTPQEMVDFCSENDIILQPVVATIPCSVALKVLLAAQSNTAESRSCAPTRLPVFGQTPQSILRAKKRLCGQNVTNTVIFQLPTNATCHCRLI